jgi:hypothetical protein
MESLNLESLKLESGANGFAKKGKKVRKSNYGSHPLLKTLSVLPKHYSKCF